MTLNFKLGYEDYSTMNQQKICALCSPKKMELLERCLAPSPKVESPQTNNQRQKKNLARLLDPHYESLTHKFKNGGHSAGTQSQK